MALFVPVALGVLLAAQGWPVPLAVLVSVLAAVVWRGVRVVVAVISWFGMGVAARVVVDVFRLPALLRRLGWTVGGCVWLRLAPGGVGYLLWAPSRGSVGDRGDVASRLAEALGATRARCSDAWLPGWVWISVQYVDPLRTPRPSLPRSLDVGTGTALVGRGLDGADVFLPVEPGLHIAIQGNTGSGKSNFARLIVLAATRAGMGISGSDVSGLLLGGVTGSDVALGADRVERHVVVLERVVAQMDEVIRRLADAGVDHWSQLEAVRTRLVLVEELPGLLACLRQDDRVEGRRPADRLTSRLEAALGRLCAEGRKAGILVVALAQRFDADLLGGSVRNNFPIRVSLRGDSASVAMLHPGCPQEAARRQPDLAPGVGLYEGPGQPMALFAADVLPAAGFTSVLESVGPMVRRSESAARSEA